MSLFMYLFSLLFVVSGCQDSTAGEKIERSGTTTIRIPNKPIVKDTVIAPLLPKPYSNLSYQKTELLQAAPGTKSVLFNSQGTKLYAMNLEGLSVYEFDQPTRKVIREFKFTATKGTGWDYAKDKPIPSLQEKPVEACFSHQDQILWVSLHNAEGIVPIFVNDLSANRPAPDTQAFKKVTVLYPGDNTRRDSFEVPLIKTGRTPKVIARTADSKHLLVSNWHSHTISVLALDDKEYPFGHVVNTIAVSAIPRGIVVDDKNDRSYVAIMGGATLSVINNTAWLKEEELNVASNPRHIVMDTSNHLFVSYNKLAQVACLDANTGKTLFTASTHAQPRTIALSKNHQFLFVTCYSGDMVEVFKINDNSFTKLSSLPCKGHPVGVDIFEDDTKLEAWVCSYSNGSINIFSFHKN